MKSTLLVTYGKFDEAQNCIQQALDKMREKKLMSDSLYIRLLFSLGFI